MIGNVECLRYIHGAMVFFSPRRIKKKKKESPEADLPIREKNQEENFHKNDHGKFSSVRNCR